MENTFKQYIGTRAVAASFSTGKAAYKHDIRQTLKKNVSQELSKDNVILIDNIQGQAIETVINKKMQPYIDEYNQKQRRKDRKITGTYTEWHNQNKTLKKTRFIYEFVGQIGEHEDLGKAYYEAQGEERAKLRQEFIKIYTEEIQDFKERYPHLEIQWATIHFDEEAGTPHFHLAITPYGEFEKQGLSLKVSIGRALECDGIMRVKDKKEAEREGGYQLTKLYNQVRRGMEQKHILSMGFQVKEHQHGRKHQTTEEWEAIQELKAEKEIAQKETDRAKQEAKAYTDYSKELKDIHEAASRDSYKPQEVERVTVGTFKKKEVIQMSEDNFQSLKSSADVKAIERQVQTKIQEQQKAAEKLVQNLTTDKEEEMQTQIQNLQQQLAKAKDEIKEKEKAIEKLKEKMQKVKEFLQSFNLIESFKRWYEKKQEQEQEFYFEGQTLEKD